jgi:hypothetical protein
VILSTDPCRWNKVAGQLPEQALLALAGQQGGTAAASRDNSYSSVHPAVYRSRGSCSFSFTAGEQLAGQQLAPRAPSSLGSGPSGLLLRPPSALAGERGCCSCGRTLHSRCS